MRYVIILLIACTIFALGVNIAAAQAQDGGAAPVVHEPPADETIEVGTTEPAAPDVENDPIGSIELFVESVRSGNWKMVGSLALALIMVLLAKVRGKIKFFAGDRGGAILVMLLGILGGFSAALAAGTAFDWKMALGVVGVVWTGVGGVTWLKRVIWPKDQETA